MTDAAQRAGRPGLVRSEAEWRDLVLAHLQAADITAFVQQVVLWVGDVHDAAELNRWVGLAQNIWNATPQPDRDGRTAYEQASGSSRSDVISAPENAEQG